MKIDEVVLNELNYPGNIGMMEMAKFYQVATPEQKLLMKKLIAENKIDQAWELLKQVSGVKLQN